MSTPNFILSEEHNEGESEDLKEICLLLFSSYHYVIIRLRLAYLLILFLENNDRFRQIVFAATKSAKRINVNIKLY